MILSVPSIRIVFGGTIGTSEIWACQLTWVQDAEPAAQPTQSALQAFANDVATRVKTFFSSTYVGPLMSSNVALTFVKVYWVPASSSTSSALAVGTLTPVSGTGSQTMPNQVALVCSLRTLSPARKGRGRFYLPALGASTTGGQLSSTVTQGVATAVATLLSGINLSTGLPLVGNVIGGSNFYPVQQIIVDTALDTQRRRRNKVIPAGTSSATVTIG